MLDTFDRLWVRLDLPRPNQEPLRGTIVIEAIDPSRMFARYSCLVGVDGRKVAHLHSLKDSASIEISSGDHYISVRLGPDVSEHLSIRIEPGERIDLVCGKKPGWVQIESWIMRRLFLMGVVGLTFATLGWFLYPLLQPAVLAAFAWCGSPNWVPTIFRTMFQNRWMTAGVINSFVLFPFYIYAGIRQQREIRRFRAEFGSNCFVAIRSPNGFKKKLALDDWDLE